MKTSAAIELYNKLAADAEYAARTLYRAAKREELEGNTDSYLELFELAGDIQLMVDDLDHKIRCLKILPTLPDMGDTRGFDGVRLESHANILRFYSNELERRVHAPFWQGEDFNQYKPLINSISLRFARAARRICCK